MPETKEVPEPQNIYEALNFLWARVGYVQKEESGDLPYTFASEPAFIRAVRPHMIDLGIICYPVAIEEIEVSRYETKRGSVAQRVLCRFTWEWMHTPSQTKLQTQTLGEGTDYGDKAANKAMTIAAKYNWRQTLMIETGDDPDYQSSEDFEAVVTRVAEERGMEPPPKKKPKKKTGKAAQRVVNQWEPEVLDAILDLQLVQSRPHAVNILNHSAFFETVPFGELDTIDGVAYVMAWVSGREKYKDEKPEEYAKRVNEAYGKFLDKAAEALGG